eukprot:gene21323-27353_t
MVPPEAYKKKYEGHSAVSGDFLDHPVKAINLLKGTSSTNLNIAGRSADFKTVVVASECYGSVFVGLECLCRLAPDVYIDTIGAAFTYPLVKSLTTARVVAYVHYPIISRDMLNKVREQRPAHNNASAITSSVTVSSLKLLYYQLFARCYSLVGSCADQVVVNSSWTRGHIAELWGFDKQRGDVSVDGLCQPCDDIPGVSEDQMKTRVESKIKSASVDKTTNTNIKNRLHLIYPPCNTTDLHKNIKLQRAVHKDGKRLVVSIGQFRPEKDHFLQIRALRALKDVSDRYDDVVLVIIGSTRNDEDKRLQESLAKEALSLGLQDSVRFEVNQPYSVLLQYMQCAVIGLHSMWNEHFGISVVEMMAAGLVVIAHNSGGPLMDIVHAPTVTPASEAVLQSGEGVTKSVVKFDENSTGFLAETAEQYSRYMQAVLDNYPDYEGLKAVARRSTLRFSDEFFMDQIAEVVEKVFVEGRKKSE